MLPPRVCCGPGFYVVQCFFPRKKLPHPTCRRSGRSVICRLKYVCVRRVIISMKLTESFDHFFCEKKGALYAGADDKVGYGGQWARGEEGESGYAGKGVLGDEIDVFKKLVVVSVSFDELAAKKTSCRGRIGIDGRLYIATHVFCEVVCECGKKIVRC